MSTVYDIPDYPTSKRGIRFIQYMRPNGRKEEQWIERDGEILAMARAIESAGFEFEAEILLAYRDCPTLSFEVISASDSADVIASAIVENGPDVPGVVDDMIRAAFAELNRREGKAE